VAWWVSLSTSIAAVEICGPVMSPGVATCNCSLKFAVNLAMSFQVLKYERLARIRRPASSKNISPEAFDNRSKFSSILATDDVSSLKQTSAEDETRDAEIDDQARDVHERGDKRGGCAGRVESAAAQQEGQHGTRNGAEHHNAHEG